MVNGDASATSPSPTTVEVGFEFVHPANVDRDRLERAVAPLKRLQLAGSIRVVVTSDMPASLAPRVQPSYSAPFRVDRVGAGRVIAKTVTDLSSSTEILLDAVVLQPELREHTEMSLVRLIEHEGLHLLLRSRGEDAHSLERALATSSEADVAYLWLAALAIEEFRIERCICARGSFASESYAEEMPRVLADYREAFDAAGAAWGVNPDAPGDVVAMTNDLMSKVACMVAQNDFDPAVSETLLASKDWRDFVGATWGKFVACAADIPDAGHALDGQTARDLVMRFMNGVVRPWCKQLGFILRDEGGLVVEPLTEVGAAVDRSESAAA